MKKKRKRKLFKTKIILKTRMNTTNLNSSAYKNSRKFIKDPKYAAKRLTTLLVRVLTRIDKITIYLGEENLIDKELKEKISLLSQLLGVKKQVSQEIKDSLGKGQNSGSSISDILKK